jgi:hypothetical protein
VLVQIVQGGSKAFTSQDDVGLLVGRLRGPPRRERLLELVIFKVRGEHFGTTSLSAKSVEVRPRQDPEQPHPRRVGLAQFAEPPERAEHRVLKQILRVRSPPAAEPQRRPVECVEVLAQQLLECSRLARS